MSNLQVSTIPSMRRMALSTVLFTVVIFTGVMLMAPGVLHWI